MNYRQQALFDNNATFVRINTICNTMYHTYLDKYPNVVGIGAAAKIQGGTSLNYPALTFLVTKKVPDSELKPEEKIPQTIENIPTDVVIVGNLVPFSSSYYDKFNNNNTFNNNNNQFNNIDYFNNNVPYSQSNERKIYPKSALEGYSLDKPVQGGDSIGFPNSPIEGTIGCAVLGNKSKSIYILSTGHVLAGNGTENREKRANIISPSPKNGGKPENILGQLYRNISPKYPKGKALGKNFNIVNAALAYVGDVKHKDDILSNTLKKGVIGYDEITLGNIGLGDEVIKVGATTKETRGKVIIVNAALKITIAGKIAIYIHQILTEPMAKAGDSGSLGLSATNPGTAFGLLMGGSDLITIYNPLKDVLSELGVQIWNSTN